MNVYRLIVVFALLITLIGVAICQSEMNETAMGITPSIIVTDQAAMGNSMIANVTVVEAVSDGPGWVVIHNNLFGHPGGVIGYARVDNGNNSNITVTIHTFVATDSLFAVLHHDRGAAGIFEYPAIDTEQRAGEQIAIVSFNASTMWDGMLMNLTQMARDSGACGE